MIGLIVKVPYFAQIRSSEPQLADQIAALMVESASAFAGTAHHIEGAFFLSFEESSRSYKLCAAQAANVIANRLRDLAPRLLGWTVMLDIGRDGRDEILEQAKRLWFRIQDDGLYLSERASAFFKGYFTVKAPAQHNVSAPAIPAGEVVYARPALPLDVDEVLTNRASDTEAVTDEVGALVTGQEDYEALCILGPGRSASSCLDAALDRLYPSPAHPFLRLRSSVVENHGYSPIVQGFSQLLSSIKSEQAYSSLVSSAERALLDELAPIIEFLGKTPYRGDFSQGFATRLGICASSALRLYSRIMQSRSLPALVILDGVDLFPDECVCLIQNLLQTKTHDEFLSLIACGSRLPECWNRAQTRIIDVSGPGPEEITEASLRAAEALGDSSFAPQLVRAAAADPLRFRLALRIASAGRKLPDSLRIAELASRALSTFPLEYSEFLLSLRLCENVLSDDGMNDFCTSLGYVSGLRPIICAALRDLGISGDGLRPRLHSLEAASSAESVLPDHGAAVKKAFVEKLLSLRESGTILSSSALYRKIRATAETERDLLPLLYDCLASDAVFGDSHKNDGASIASPLEPLGVFLARYAEGDREGSGIALENLENSAEGYEEGLVSAAATLGRAAFDYAEGRIAPASSKAKTALMSLHAVGAHRAEARAHRILGLCALALGQAQEGADYLANAFDLAAAIPDPMESFLSITAEAAALFTLGDIGRALHCLESSTSWAAAAFRADWEAVAAFLEGRIALELGRTSEAEQKFGAVRTLARIYNLPKAAIRAEIWTGRAAAFAGDETRAKQILSRHDADAEALWFLAEAACWAGEIENAATLAARAFEIAPVQGFASADDFDWSSGFASFESRVVGFCASRTYLADQLLAFKEYTAGLADPKIEAESRAARLLELTREDRIAVLHPQAHLYAFYHYLVLERANPGSMNATTALSKAFKALQLRSARMIEASLKDGFMEGNRWNRALMTAARDRKLI